MGKIVLEPNFFDLNDAQYRLERNKDSQITRILGENDKKLSVEETFKFLQDNKIKL